MPRPTYTLTLTTDEFRAVGFARGRYEWADALYDLHVIHDLSCGFVFLEGHESDWWAVCEAVKADDAPYPLASRSLAFKIDAFLDKFI